MVHLLYLHPGEKLYEEVACKFRQGWLHPGHTATICNIFYVVYDGAEAQKHLAANRSYLQAVQGRVCGPAESYLFHGTQRACTMGDSPCDTTPCHNSGCHVCSIVRCSFHFSHIGQNLMFGPGFYTTPVSSKADFYVKNSHIRTHKHAMLLGNVTTGNKQLAYHPDHNMRPAPGYDSVEAVTKSHGGAVEYTENIVYKEEAILPSIVIIYTRTGWTGH